MHCNLPELTILFGIYVNLSPRQYSYFGVPTAFICLFLFVLLLLSIVKTQVWNQERSEFEACKFYYGSVRL